MKACITYAKVTDESAEIGDHSEHGWWMPGGWEFALSIMGSQHNEQVLAEARAGEYEIPWREAMEHAKDLGCTETDVSGNEFCVRTVDDSIDMHTGERTSYTLHIECKSERRAQWMRAIWGSK